MNDQERENFIDNDEGLYRLWKASRSSKRKFIKANRSEIDSVIANVTTAKQPAHYLLYGGNK